MACWRWATHLVRNGGACSAASVKSLGANRRDTSPWGPDDGRHGGFAQGGPRPRACCQFVRDGRLLIPAEALLAVTSPVDRRAMGELVPRMGGGVMGRADESGWLTWWRWGGRKSRYLSAQANRGEDHDVSQGQSRAPSKQTARPSLSQRTQCPYSVNPFLAQRRRVGEA